MISPGFNTSASIPNNGGTANEYLIPAPMFSNTPYTALQLLESNSYIISGDTVPTAIQFSNTDTFFINAWVDYRNTVVAGPNNNPRLRNFDIVSWGKSDVIGGIENTIRFRYFGSNASTEFNRITVDYRDSSNNLNSAIFVIDNFFPGHDVSNGFPLGSVNVGVYFDVNSPGNSWICLNGVTGNTATTVVNGVSTINAYEAIRFGYLTTNYRDMYLGDIFIGNNNWTMEDAIKIYSNGLTSQPEPPRWYCVTDTNPVSLNAGEIAFNEESQFISAAIYISGEDFDGDDQTELLESLAKGQTFTITVDGGDSLVHGYNYLINSVSSGATFYTINFTNVATGFGFSIAKDQVYELYFSVSGSGRSFLLQNSTFSDRHNDILYYNRLTDYTYDGNNFNTKELYDVISGEKMTVVDATPEIRVPFGGNTTAL